jgi:hypothetical protein
VGEVVVRGVRLPVRTQIAAELYRRAIELTGDASDRAVLGHPSALMSMSFDDLQPEQAVRIARAMVTAAEEIRRPYSVPGGSPADVETAAQLAAIGMIVARSYGLA